jgi:hypothetical protein
MQPDTRTMIPVTSDRLPRQTQRGPENRRLYIEIMDNGYSCRPKSMIARFEIRFARFLRWQPRTYLQAWLTALVTGGLIGVVMLLIFRPSRGPGFLLLFALSLMACTMLTNGAASSVRIYRRRKKASN